MSRCTHITSSGVLKLINRKYALVHLVSERIIPLQHRQMVGMKYDNSNTRRTNYGEEDFEEAGGFKCT